MIRNGLKTAVMVVVALSATGCGARMASVSNQSTAYAVRAGVLGTDMYYCTAENPQQPVCTKVEEN